MKTPVRYSKEIAAIICERLADGEALDRICEDTPGMPTATAVRLWALKDHDGFASEYARARELQAHKLAEEIRQIADSPEEGVTTTTKADGGIEEKRGDMIEHRKLRIDARKWYLSKVLPKVYGDKQQIEHSGTVSIADRLREARAKRET
jgi:hypothetical protein